jgi:antitoxin VapB
MPLNIKNDDIHERAKQLAVIINSSITEAVDIAIREALERRRYRYEKKERSMIDELTEIAEQTASFPVYDRREPDEIIGYNDEGVPD